MKLKKLLIFIILVFVILSACSSEKENNQNNSNLTNDDQNKVINLFGLNNQNDVENLLPSISATELDSINGKVSFYEVTIEDYNQGYVDDEVVGEKIEKSYKINYDNKYEEPDTLKAEAKPYCKTTYNESLKPIKEEIFNSDGTLFSVVINKYDDRNGNITIEKKYNNNLYIILQREYSPNCKLKKESIFDDYGRLVNSRIFSYNQLGQITQETLLNEKAEQLEFKIYKYDSKNLIKEEYYTGDGILQSETTFNKFHRPISNKYYSNGKKLNYQEEISYFSDDITIKSKKDFDDAGNPIQETIFDKNGNQIEVISYKIGKIIERKKFIYSIVKGLTLLDKMEIYTDDSNEPTETMSYFYDETTGEVNNWIKYDKDGKAISSMDNESASSLVAPPRNDDFDD